MNKTHPPTQQQAPQLTHRQLALFRAVMRHGQLGRAAQAMGSSQPTLSRDLARLEQVLGFTLFDRVSGRLRATSRGLAFLQEVERSFVGLDQIGQRALELRHQSGGRLRLACLPALAQALVPQALRLWLAQHPHAAVSVLPQESPWLEQSLSEQQVDMGLSETEHTPAGCESEVLYQGHEVVVLPQGHLLTHKSVLTPADFEGQAFISLAPGDTYRSQIDQLFEQHGVQRQMGLETASAVAICAMVRQSLGVAIVNPLTAAELAATGLAIRPLSVPIRFQVSLIRPMHVAAHPLGDALAAALRSVVSTTPV